MKVIVLRYSEIHLKGKNRGFFEAVLVKNIKQVLSNFEYKFIRNGARYLISDYDENRQEEIIDKLSAVFGIYSLSVAHTVSTDIGKICEKCLELSRDSGGFKVITNRADKTFNMTSMEVSAEVGHFILQAKKSLKVDLHAPDWTINIDIREKGTTLIYSDTIYCVNGMPVGTAGKGIVLLSGGIDSPVATYMMAKRGMTLRALHFHSYPFTSLLAKEKVLDLARLLKKYCITLTVDVVNFKEIQLAIHENCPEEYMITIMRRFMMRIAQKLAYKHDAKALITGESLGQVASQTIESLTSTSEVTTLPILRPLIGFDKDEIIAISKQIGTFTTSIQPYEDCCTVFLPKSPVIHPKLDTVNELEKALDIDKLVEQALSDVETVCV